MSTSPLEIRMAHLEGAYEQINARLGAIEERLGRLEDRFGRLEDRFGRLEDRFIRFDDKLDVRIDSLRSELLVRMDRQFYWILSLVVLAILVPIFLRLLSV
jgi:predicted nuclease with TOPRIM domain